MLMQYIDVPEFGGPEAMQLAQMKVPVPQKGELLVKVHASGVNRADILQREGKYPPPSGESPIIGLEVCGEVMIAGGTIATGRKVFGLVAGGGYGQYCIVKEELAFDLPNNMSVFEGAAFTEAYLTAYQTLFVVGGLTVAKTALIHAGASGVGAAAIRLTKLAGARAIVTVSSDEKKAFCEQLGADLAINYNKEDFVSVIKNQKEVVNVVLDCVAGDYIARDLQCLGFDGKIVHLIEPEKYETQIHFERSSYFRNLLLCLG